MFEEYSPHFPVARLLGHSGFGNDVGSVEAAPSDDTQEITFLGGCLMWNNAAVGCGNIWSKYLVVSGLTYGKFLERESAVIFSVPLMCCEYRDVSLLTSVHPIQHATASWDYAFTG